MISFLKAEEQHQHKNGLSSNAQVSGDARVSGNAQVSGNARVNGNAKEETMPITKEQLSDIQSLHDRVVETKISLTHAQIMHNEAVARFENYLRTLKQ